MGAFVALEFAPTVIGKIIKTHEPLHGDKTYDVEVRYKAGCQWYNPEVVRVRDMPARCLILKYSEELVFNNPECTEVVNDLTK